jgi:hypothetical protein
MTTQDARAARDAALLAWFALGPASLSAESDAAWAAYKAASAVVARGQSETTGIVIPPPVAPPPPSEVSWNSRAGGTR